MAWVAVDAYSNEYLFQNKPRRYVIYRKSWKWPEPKRN